MAYGSVATHGDALVGSLVRDGGFRVVYRPHPRAGTTSSAYRAADARVRALLGEAPATSSTRRLRMAAPGGRRLRHRRVVDGRRLAGHRQTPVVTVPAAPGVTLPTSRLLDLAPRVTAAHAGDAPGLVRAALTAMPEGWDGLVEYYVGDTTPGAATARFQDAVRSVLPG